jgi:hypothetical protein
MGYHVTKMWKYDWLLCSWNEKGISRFVLRKQRLGNRDQSTVTQGIVHKYGRASSKNGFFSAIVERY